jgi:UDP-3-O-[3-hydroxymyristoyl] glucosamine N-acyltransferase
MTKSKRQKIKKLLSEIALILNGKLYGEDLLVNGIAPFNKSRPNTVIVLDNGKDPKDNQYAACIINSRYKLNIIDKPYILVDDTKLALKKLIDVFYPEEDVIDKTENTAVISKSVKKDCPVYIGHYTVIDQMVNIGKNTYIGNFVKIGNNVTIGSNVKLYDSVIINDNTAIGDNVIIYSSAVIGSEGFGYIFREGKRIKIRHVGNVIIENDVEIGSNTCIDRATIDSTIIGEGTKIDNLVQIGHNVKIGKNCIIIAETGISGSCNIGNNVIIGGQVGIADHVDIPDDTTIASKSGVIGTIKKSGIYAGFPAIDHMQWLRNMAVIKDIHKVKKIFDKYKEVNRLDGN